MDRKVSKIVGGHRFDDKKYVTALNLAEMDEERNKLIDAAWDSVVDNYYNKSNFGPGVIVLALGVGLTLGILINQFFLRIGGGC